MDRDDKYSTKHVNGSKVDDDNDHHGRKSRTLSVGWSLKSAGGLVITYRAMVASTLSVRSRYLKGELKQRLKNSWKKKVCVKAKSTSYIRHEDFLRSFVLLRHAQGTPPGF